VLPVFLTLGPKRPESLAIHVSNELATVPIHLECFCPHIWWVTVLHGPLVFLHASLVALATFFLDCLFKDICRTAGLGREKLSLPMRKDLSFLKLGFFYNIPQTAVN
jgi:hypothetical protein